VCDDECTRLFGTSLSCVLFVCHFCRSLLLVSLDLFEAETVIETDGMVFLVRLFRVFFLQLTFVGLFVGLF